MKKTLLCLAAALVMITSAAAQEIQPAYLMTKEDMHAIWQQSFDRMNTTMGDATLMTLDELPAWEAAYTARTGIARKDDLVISSLPMEGDKPYEEALALAKGMLMQKFGVAEETLDALGVYPRLLDHVYGKQESEWEFYFTPLRDTDIMLDHALPAGGEYLAVFGARSGRTITCGWYNADQPPEERLADIAQEAALEASGMEKEAFLAYFEEACVHHYNQQTSTCLAFVYARTADQPDGDNRVYQVTLNYQTGEVLRIEYTNGVG